MILFLPQDSDQIWGPTTIVRQTQASHPYSADYKYPHNVEIMLFNFKFPSSSPYSTPRKQRFIDS